MTLRGAESIRREPGRLGAVVGSQCLEQFANLVVALEGMPKRQLRVELVAVAPPVPLAREVPVFHKFGDDALGGAFGDAHRFGDVS